MSTPASDVHERLKTNGAAIKITRSERILTINKRIQFGGTFTETTIFIYEDKYYSVSKNPESLSLKLKFVF